MDYIMTNWDQILIAAFAVLGAFSAIAKLTPTEADDQVIQKAYDFIHALGLTKKE